MDKDKIKEAETYTHEYSEYSLPIASCLWFNNRKVRSRFLCHRSWLASYDIRAMS